MTTPPSHCRTTLAGALLVVLALGTSACGGDADASDDPTETPTTSATPTPTPTPTATPSQTPQSPFEDRPQVQALRRWADAVTRDINARQREFPSAQQVEVATDKVRRDVSVSFHEEFDKYFPGPLPFTPVAVKGSAGRTTITTCVIGAGFALKQPGGEPAEKREVIPVVFTMAKEHGSWLLAGIVRGTADCGGVDVEGIQW